MQDEVIFQSDDATVTKTLVRIKAASYPIARIESVEVVEAAGPTPLFSLIGVVLLDFAIGWFALDTAHS